MKRLLVWQHVPYEILGTLNPLLKEAGFRIRYVNFGRDPHQKPSIDRYDGIVILGGPMNVDETDRYPHLLTEMRLLEKALKKNLPILGICLGAQLIAKTLGATVKPNPEKEIGWYSVKLTDAGKEDLLLQPFGEEQKIFQWHGDTFDLPSRAIHLASSLSCAQQAFSYQKNVYGFQFHLEVDQAMIERWLNIPIHQKEIESLDGKIVPNRIRKETAQFIGNSIELSKAVFSNFISLFGELKEKHALPSR